MTVTDPSSADFSQRQFAKIGVRVLGIVFLVFTIASTSPAANGGELEINVVDSKTREPIAVRMHLKNRRGRSVKVRSVNVLNFDDHFTFDGKIVLDLPTGPYTFEMERGPEYKIRTGNFQIKQGATDNKTVEMERFVDMAAEGWYSGDLDIRRSIGQVPQLMLAEDLRVGFVHEAKNKKRASTTDKHESTTPTLVGSERVFAHSIRQYSDQDGTVSLFSTRTPGEKLELGSYPWSFFVGKKQAPLESLHVDLSTMTHQDLPAWLASGNVHSAGVMNADLLRSGETKSPIGKQLDDVKYSGPDALGRFCLDTYYELLNSGLRIPPTAGSGSGSSTNPVGYNRVYVYCDDGFTYENWWRNLRAGRCMITNGPMLRTIVDGRPPGSIFRGYKGDELKLDVALTLSTRDKISYLQIVKDGRSVQEVRLDEFAKAKGKLPPVTFKQSGWFLVRAICDDASKYRYASSAPFYVDFETPIAEPEAKRFFLDWAELRLAESGRSENRSLIRYQKGAVNFWKKQLQSTK